MIKLVIFDLDGTLADTIDDLAGAVNRALARRGFPTHEPGAYKLMVGNGFRNLVIRALPEAYRSDALVEEFRAEAVADYEKHCLDLTRPYEGVPELLDSLASRNLSLAILSNKPHAQTLKVTSGLFPATRFHIIRGETSEFPRKPDPSSALDIARRLDTLPSESAYLGDSDVDMRTARAAGMLALGAGWGFRGAAELAEAGAFAVLDAPGQMLRYI